MTFSIITITYNSVSCVKETIASVLSQSCPDLEYILVDGGSTDGTVEIISGFAAGDPRVRWISERDAGISDAFNKGIALAGGDLIGIINSDDAYLPETLRLVAESAAVHPECDVFHGDMVRLDRTGQELFVLKPLDVEASVWREMPVNHPATFVRRRAYGKVGGFDVALRYAMDYDLVLRLHKAGCRFCYIDRPLAAMRYGGASDASYVRGLREVFAVSVREGYPRQRALFWFLVKGFTRTAKNLLRSLGLYRLIRLHPRFR
ncbi:MAG: glycosyltransferase [Geobacteraceae bacterium]|nr:glycosyltransferase [Geobacteraceae bacterium]